MNAEALVEKAIREYTALYSELKRVQEQFEQCVRQSPSLYYEAISTLNEPLSQESWSNFIAANELEDSDSEWEAWEVDPDGDYCAHYYGDQKWFENYRRLAESGFLVLEGIKKCLTEFTSMPTNWKLELPAFDGYAAWTHLVDSTAVISTPFLRKVGRVWNLPDDYEGDSDQLMYETWETPPEGGDRFPKHPFCVALQHDLFRSSVETIREWLEPDIVPTVGECYGESPITLCSPETLRDHIVVVQPGGAKEPTPTPSLLEDLAEVKCPHYEAGTYKEVDWGHYGKLSVGKIVVKEYKQPAELQCLILSKFEEAHWVRRIPNPVLRRDQSSYAKELAYNSLRSRLSEFSNSLDPKLLKFKPVNRGADIEWLPLAPWSDFLEGGDERQSH
jgi:hypothetical protein